MPFDAHKNLAITTIVTPPGPGGTTCTVTAGQGAFFPAPPFNATVWPVNQPPTPVNAEVIRVTVVAGDVLTFARAQEGSSTRTMLAGDLLAATVTAKTLTDVEAEFAGVAYLAKVNTFTALQAIRFNAPVLQLYDTGAAPQARVVQMVAIGGEYWVQFASDDATAQQSVPLKAFRGGDVKIERDVYEKGRTTPIGHWTNNAAYLPAGGWTGTYKYALVGKSLHLMISASHASLAAGTAPPIVFGLPATMAADATTIIYGLFQSGGWGIGAASVPANNTLIQCFPQSGNFAGGATTISITTTIAIA